MLCLKAEVLAHDMYGSHGVILPVNLGRSIQRVMHKVGRGVTGGEGSSRRPDPLSSSSSAAGDGAPSCSGLEDDHKSNDSGSGQRRGRMGWYRIQLEQEVQRLQKQLQEEIDLHVALANAVGYTAPLFRSSKLPDKAQELVDNISELEMTVSKLEDELLSLHLQLCNERNEHRLAESNLGCLPSILSEPSSTSSINNWEEHISSLRVSKFGMNQMSASSVQQDMLFGYGDSESYKVKRPLHRCQEEVILELCNKDEEVKKKDASLRQSDGLEIKKCIEEMNLFGEKILWHNPNQLSEEMVRCMRNIFLCLSESSNVSLKACSSDGLPSKSSSVGHFSSSSFTSFSDSSIMPSTLHSPSTGTHQNDVLDQQHTFDPYGANNKAKWGSIGSYGLATEVSWMSVGKAQLDYAAEALKRFRFLVEQLAKVNPAHMNGNKRLAFWINVYNALIMHAYLAYGVPKSDIKLFSLMQMASYTIGGQLFNAAEIEFVILKMKPPAHRPQLALVLALHKFKISEEHKKYSVESPEPLTLFALGCGMYSSPAVRIFTADNLEDELQNSMRDYIQASIGISDKGKLLVPKLLHSFAKDVVEDSFLVDWICRFLSPDQVTIVRDSTSQRKQRLLGARSYSVIPYDSRFRFLFLPDNKTSQRC